MSMFNLSGLRHNNGSEAVESISSLPSSSPLESLTRRINAAIQPEMLKTAAGKKEMATCLREIARMYKSSPNLHASLSELRERINVSKTWVDLDLPPSLLKTDYESVRFLVKERLIYTIVGLTQTSAFGMDQLHINSGKISILCDGEFVPVSSLFDRFSYDKDDFQYKEKETGLFWNYLLPKGLTPIDRYSSEQTLPTTQLSPSEMEKLLSHVKQFEGLPFTEENPVVGVLQIVTNPRKVIKPNSFLFDGLESESPVHVGFRIIDEKGNVYSSGFTFTHKEEMLHLGVTRRLATINGVPDMTDFEEFRPHEGRRVTSIPMSQVAFDRVMTAWIQMRKQGVRYNLWSQNCANMASYMMDLANVHIDHGLSAYRMVSSFFPSTTSFPCFQRMIEKIMLLSHKLSELTLLPSIEEDITLTSRAVKLLLTPLRLTTNLFLNLILMGFGAHKGSPMKENMYEDSSKQNALRKRFAIISSPKDLFSTPTIYHSGPIISWQDRQQTTCFYKYSTPSMNVLPVAATVPSAHRRPYERFSPKMAAMRRRIALVDARRHFFHTLGKTFKAKKGHKSSSYLHKTNSYVSPDC